MKCLSIRPPWSTMIVAGIKPVENRKWYCRHRGPLLIHSSKTWDSEGADWIVKVYPEMTGFIRHSRHLRGYIIGRVNMTDCVRFHESKWFFGQFGLVFDKPHEFDRDEAIPYKGRLGLFNVDLDLEAPRKHTQKGLKWE